jgi:hypothetical protein
MPMAGIAAALVLFGPGQHSPAAPPAIVSTRAFTATTAGEAAAVVHALCARCGWGVTGREAIVLSIALDNRYSQHLVLVRGDRDADYHIALGPVPAGEHRLTIAVDPTLSSREAGPVAVSGVDVTVLPGESDAGLALSLAPILHARANTVGHFTDVPILMWYEIVPTARGRQYRYSVIFTNEDGGTATDRLMATWGRTTDIEYVYGVELDAAGAVIAEEIQAAGHKYPPFQGRHEARHPLLWVDTDNNMVADHGTTTIRYLPVPELFDLTITSREAVMDAHAWSYQVAAQEMIREGKIRGDAEAGSGAIPDPRRFVYVEACTELRNAALAFSIRAADSTGRETWYDSDRGLPEFRIVRTGCFRGAVPLAAGAAPPSAIRFRAFTKRDERSQGPSRVTLTRVNRVFTLGEDYLPGVSRFSWTGSIALDVDGAWRELPFASR